MESVRGGIVIAWAWEVATFDNDCDNDGVRLTIYISPTPRNLGFRTACAHVLEY
jgi:hypothetical protein